MKALKYLIWTYVGFLLVEGALRKWLLPRFSDPLLIIRDPIVLLIYVQALRLGIFPKTPWLAAMGIVGLGAVVAGLLSEFFNVFVLVFGVRTDFLHLPLIFVLAKAFDETDVKRVGAAFLLLALPMTLLMAIQFRAGPHDWINAGVGGEGQISSAMGRIRPAATFSFISGPVYFFAAVTAFALSAHVNRSQTPLWLSALGGGATLLACTVSGSRSMLAAVALVVVALGFGLILHPSAFPKVARMTVLGTVVVWLVSGPPNFSEGQEVLKTRISNAANSEGGLNGFLTRFAGTFAAPVSKLLDVPLFGHGFGLGTNGGAALTGVRGKFLLAEGEWDRLFMESGPVIGLAIIALRTLLAAYLGWLACLCARQGRFLPLLLFSAAGLGLINGQWGQPTSQGFASLVGGLCLASMNRRTEEQPVAEITNENTPALREAIQTPGPSTAVGRRLSGVDELQPGRFAVQR